MTYLQNWLDSHDLRFSHHPVPALSQEKMRFETAIRQSLTPDILAFLQSPTADSDAQVALMMALKDLYLESVFTYAEDDFFAPTIFDVYAEAMQTSLIEMTRHPAENVRRVAAYALGDLGVTSAVGCLRQMLADPKSSVCQAALKSLRCLGESVTEDPADEMAALHRQLADKSGDVRLAAIAQFLEKYRRTLQQSCLAPVAHHLFHDRALYVRQEICTLLRKPVDLPWQVALLHRLALKDKKCESAALSALVAHSEYFPIPAQAFLNTLEDADCQRVALGVMGIVESRWPEALQHLLEALEPIAMAPIALQQQHLRKVCLLCEALGVFAAAAAPALPCLLALIRQFASAHDLLEVFQCIGLIGDPSAIPVLLDVLTQNEGVYTAEAAKQALIALGWNGDEHL